MKKKILIVDDEMDIVRAVSLRLESLGYETFAAFDGFQAVTMSHKVKPDLVILDVMMPAGDGFSVVDRLRKSVQTWAVPVVFLTALTKKEIDEKAKELGAVAVLHKPYSTEELISTIESILGKVTKEEPAKHE